MSNDPPKPEDYGATPDLWDSDYDEYMKRYLEYRKQYYLWVREYGFERPGDCAC